MLLLLLKVCTQADKELLNSLFLHYFLAFLKLDSTCLDTGTRLIVLLNKEIATVRVLIRFNPSDKATSPTSHLLLCRHSCSWLLLTM